MHLLLSGVDISVIALWLGHERPTTTHMYVEADLAMKDRALARLQAPDSKVHRYRAPDRIAAVLKNAVIMQDSRAVHTPKSSRRRAREYGYFT